MVTSSLHAARAAGAAALLVDHRLDIDIAQVVVPDTRRAMGWLAASFFGHPSRNLTMVGVTGTNGKTTTTSLISSILESAEASPTGTIGTLTGAHTTPESPDLQSRLAEFVEQRRHRRRHGGVVARARAAPCRRLPLRHRSVHQPRPRSPRLARHPRAVLRRKGKAVPAGSGRSRQSSTSTIRTGDC